MCSPRGLSSRAKPPPRFFSCFLQIVDGSNSCDRAPQDKSPPTSKSNNIRHTPLHGVFLFRLDSLLLLVFDSLLEGASTAMTGLVSTSFFQLSVWCLLEVGLEQQRRDVLSPPFLSLQMSPGGGEPARRRRCRVQLMSYTRFPASTVAESTLFFFIAFIFLLVLVNAVVFLELRVFFTSCTMSANRKRTGRE